MGLKRSGFGLGVSVRLQGEKGLARSDGGGGERGEGEYGWGGAANTKYFASPADGKMGANSTGVRKWRAFCAAEGTTPARPMDGNTVCTPCKQINAHTPLGAPAGPKGSSAPVGMSAAAALRSATAALCRRNLT